jgi:hypothetical protein
MSRAYVPRGSARLDDPERQPVVLLRAYDAIAMKGFPVEPQVGNVRNNEPGLCERNECPPTSA